MSNLLSVQDDRGRSMGRVDPSTGFFLTDDGRELRPQPDDELQFALAERAAYNARRTLMNDHAAVGDRRLMVQTIGDVRTETPMPNFMQGYALVDGIADVICPVIEVDAPSKQYWEWNSQDAFQRPGNIEASPGALVREISPRLSKTRFDTIERALAAAVPTELIAAAQAPIDPLAAAIRRVQTAMRLEREVRVVELLTTAGNWDTSVVTTLGATAKWNGGSASDPIADLVKIIQGSWAPVTRIIMGEQAAFAFSTNANVQKYIAYKTGAAPVPASAQISALFTLPPITVVNQKYNSTGTGLTYTWGNDVVLVHEPGNLPADGQDIMTCATFRWNGGAAPDGAFVNGWLVRTYFDAKRGPRGSTVVVVTNQDGEVMTSKLAGGLIKAAYQP